MRSSAARRARFAECAYLLDRAIKHPTSTEDFARAALDVLRLALRPSYAALVCRSGSTFFRCGDSALAGDLDRMAELLSRAPRSLLADPRTLHRRDAARAGLPELERAMTASALDLVFPVTDGASLLGAFVLGPRSERGSWSPDDLEFCDRIGARLAVIASRESLSAEAAALRAAASSSERLASVGRMAAGLAHEIRNPLVSIRTFTQLLPERHADEEFRSDFLELTLSEIDRISTLVGEILQFARPASASGGGDAGEAVDAAECIDRTCQLLRSHARSAGVALVFQSREISTRAAIDEDKLRQVVINLVVNGIQACDGRGSVRVTVSPAPDGAILVAVEDDGRGMDPSVVDRIFEPFFTTRAEGTGLGLALVRRILDEAGATIEVRSKAGAGTRFTIRLRADGMTDAASPARSSDAGIDDALLLETAP